MGRGEKLGRAKAWGSTVARLVQMDGFMVTVYGCLGLVSIAVKTSIHTDNFTGPSIELRGDYTDTRVTGRARRAIRDPEPKGLPHIRIEPSE